MSLAMYITIGAVLVLYIFLMQSLAYFWIVIRDQTGQADAMRVGQVKASLIVACRNEEQNLANLFACIENQTARADQLEIIIVDDYSTDNSLEILAKCADSSPFEVKILSLKEGEGKKAAIALGVSKAVNPMLIFTDADCRFEKDWVVAHMHAFLDGNEFTSGPVMFEDEKTFWQRLMQLEFLGLIASGGAGIALKWNWMANAANMSVSRDAYASAMTEVDGNQKASGDDAYLLASLSKQKAKIGFLKSRQAMVQTSYEPSLKTFLNQRMRWASKGASYLKPMAKFSAIVIFLMNLIASFIPLIFWADGTLMIVIVLAIKLLADLWFYSFALSFFGKKKLLGYVIPAQIFHIPYVVLTAILGSFLKYNWKGRETR